MFTTPSTTLDLPTLTTAMAVVYFCSFVLALMLLLHRRSFPGAAQWIAGQALLALGALGIAVGAPASAALLAVSDIALLSGLIFTGHSIWKYRFGKSFPLWVYIIAPLGLAAAIILQDSGTGPRHAVFSGLLCLLSGALVALLLAKKGEHDLPRVSLPVLACFVISVAALFALAYFACGSGKYSADSVAVVRGLCYLAALFIAFFNQFGYILISSARAEQDLRAREDEIQRRNEELKATIETKDTIISVMGHDLRAPVTSASRYVRNHLLDFEGDLNTKRESLETLAQGLERLSGLLESLLEWSLGASGRIQLQAEPLRVREVLAEAMADNLSAATAKGVVLEDPTGDGTISADRRALATVFRNILSNAVKYSRSGSAIRIGIHDIDGGTDKPRVAITIDDSGVGMKPDQIARLFVPGRTILTLGTGGEQGRGFGLAISRVFVEAMSGEIRVKSELGKGTRFEIVFPITRIA